MKINKRRFRGIYILIIIFLIGSISMSSCRRARYRRMIKKRRAGMKKQKRYRGPYQRKLKKRAVHTKSTYYIKEKRNYRRRPWYDNH